jgi:MFS family permease
VSLAQLARPLASYAGLFRTPGPAGFVTAGFVSRLTTSMVTVALVLAVTAHGGGYAAAGVAVAALLLAGGLALPFYGRLYDRYGQRRVLRPMVLAFGALMVALIATIAARGPAWLVIVVSAAAGGCMPVAGPLVRARWTKLYQGTLQLRLAYGFESATIEVVYIVGPILVTALVTGIGWLAGLAAVVACALGGTLALAAQRSTEPAPAGQVDRTRRTASALLVPALRPLYAARFCIGGVFGAVPIATIAYATAHHGRAFSGLLLGLWGATSMLAGLIYGALKERAPLHRRLVVSVAVFAAGGLPLLAVRGLLTLAAALLLAGVAMAPVTVSAMEVMQAVVPTSMLTETISWDGTLLSFGMTAGTVIAGAAVGHIGISRIYAVPAGFGVLALIMVAAGSSQIRDGCALSSLQPEARMTEESR